MSLPHGVSSMVSPLREVLVQRPTAAFGSAFDDPDLGYLHPVDLTMARKEHEGLCELLAQLGATVHDLGGDSPSADLVYTYDPTLVTRRGAILLRPGKSTRRGEERVHRAWYDSVGIPIIGEIEAPGTVDGGDVLWLTSDRVAVGRSLRTNQAGIDQLRLLLDEGVHVFDVPYHSGPAACLHLMSALSFVADDLAVVESALLPSGLYRMLADLEVSLIEIPPDESATLGANVLAVRPGVVVVVDGNRGTRAALERHGVEVHAIPGNEIAINGTGGPTCLTRPILRA